jgi:hypothetical protein
MVEVPAENVSPVVVVKVQALQVIVDEPSVRDRVFELFEVTLLEDVILKFPVSTAPLVSVNTPLRLKFRPNVQPPPTPLNVMEQFVVPVTGVNVLPVVVALNVIVPLAFHIAPATNVIDPLTARVPVLVNVTAPAEWVKSKQVSAPVSVTV